MVKWLVKEELSEKALDLFDRWVSERTEMLAPKHLVIEVTNTLTTYHRRKLITREQAEQKLGMLEALPLLLFEEDFNAIRASLRLSLENAAPLYDAIYVYLAKTKDATLVSADEGQLAWARRDVSVESLRG